MDGLSHKKRKAYLGLLTLVFIIAAPAVALYSSGYRLSSDFEVIKTGGIHVDVPTAGAHFYLDEGFEGSGSIFQKSFFVQNLTPDMYTVRIEKEGYHPWRKQLEVFPTVITEARALLVQKEPTLTPIPQTILTNGNNDAGEDESTNTNRIENPRYYEIESMFTATSTGIMGAPEGATTTIQYQNATTTVYVRGGIGLWLDQDGLHARWLEDEDESPHVFCRHDECEREILVWDRASEIRHFDFLPNDNLFVLLGRDDGVVVTELDVRVPQNTLPLYLKGGTQFRIIEGVVYILDGDKLFELTF